MKIRKFEIDSLRQTLSTLQKTAARFDRLARANPEMIGRDLSYQKARESLAEAEKLCIQLINNLTDLKK